mmetsp:Transcript_34254/g.82485  ORF Transcript_34254/g.82485 Transcript_34254/m.82485 type:complete len:214 (-) Transcript_34254:986-1627(-)
MFFHVTPSPNWYIMEQHRQMRCTFYVTGKQQMTWNIRSRFCVCCVNLLTCRMVSQISSERTGNLPVCRMGRLYTVVIVFYPNCHCHHDRRRIHSTVPLTCRPTLICIDSSCTVHRAVSSSANHLTLYYVIFDSSMLDGNHQYQSMGMMCFVDRYDTTVVSLHTSIDLLSLSLSHHHQHHYHDDGSSDLHTNDLILHYWLHLQCVLLAVPSLYR